MKILIAVLGMMLVAAPALAQRKSCDELKAEIEAKVTANGVKAFTLSIVPNDQALVGTRFFNQAYADDASANPLGLILPELDQVVVSAGADYEITPNITAFFEGTFAFTSGKDQAGWSTGHANFLTPLLVAPKRQGTPAGDH